MRLFIISLFSFTILSSNAQTYDFSQNITTADGLLTDFVECISMPNNIGQTLWVGTPLGVQALEPVFPSSVITSWTISTYTTANNPGIPSDNIKVINALNNGNVWIGTDFGAALFNGVSWTTYNSTNGLVNNQVRSISEDPNGGIWIGTIQGLSHFNGTTWVSYSSPDIHWSGVSDVDFDSNGDAWIGSPLGGITHFDGINFTSYDTSNGLLSQNVTSLLVDNQDNKWVGTGGGLSVLNAANTSFTQHTQMYLMPPPDTLNPVVELDNWWSSSAVWAAIYVGYLAEGGVAYWNGSQWEDYDTADGIIGPNVKGITLHQDGIVFVATTSGISIGYGTWTSNINANETQTVSVCPNPAASNIKILAPEFEDATIMLCNSIGQIVYQGEINKELDINVSSYASGIYNLVINSDDQSERHQIIVK